MKLSVVYVLIMNLFSSMFPAELKDRTNYEEAQALLEEAGYSNILMFPPDPGACFFHEEGTKFTAKIFDNLHHIGHVCTGGPLPDEIFFVPRLAPPVVDVEYPNRRR